VCGRRAIDDYIRVMMDRYHVRAKTDAVDLAPSRT
jgi:hypothetical protein